MEGAEPWNNERWIICAYVLPYHSIFLLTHFGKFGKCRLEPTQTATTSSILCRWHGPICPKLERHVMSSPTCRDMSATFPPKGRWSQAQNEMPSLLLRKKSSYCCIVWIHYWAVCNWITGEGGQFYLPTVGAWKPNGALARAGECKTLMMVRRAVRWVWNAWFWGQIQGDGVR